MVTTLPDIDKPKVHVEIPTYILTIMGDKVIGVDPAVSEKSSDYPNHGRYVYIYIGNYAGSYGTYI